MEHNGTLAGDDGLMLASARGAKVRDAARRAGVSERTAYRRRRDADFRRAVFETQDRLLDAARGQMTGLANKAVATLERLMESDRPAVALAAAKAVLQLGPRLRKSTELEERINRSEDEADENTNANQTPADDDERVLASAAGAAVPDDAVPDNTPPDAAEKARVGEQTEQPTARDAGAAASFQRAVSRARGQMLVTALGGLARLASKATGIFERLMDNDNPSVARRAAKAVLELGPRLRESTELEERMSRLEGQAEEFSSISR